MEGNMQRKLVLSLIACAGLSFASATVALADDTSAPDTSAGASTTDTSSTATTTPDPGDSGNGTGGGPGQNSGDSSQK
jgi:hypothetical protein